MRNLSIPTLETIDSGFTGVDGIRYYAMAYYPHGKRDSRFWIISLYSVGGKGVLELHLSGVEREVPHIQFGIH